MIYLSPFKDRYITFLKRYKEYNSNCYYTIVVLHYEKKPVIYYYTTHFFNIFCL